MSRHTLAEASALILKAYRRYYRQHGFPPSQRDLASGSHFSLTALHYWLGRMEADGTIERDAGKRRAIRVRKRKAS